jgi:hypothetical protein
VRHSRRLFLGASLAWLAAPARSRAGAAGPVAGGATLDVLRKTFRDPPHAAKPMTRWWWFGGAVTPAEVTRELGFMKDAGLRGAEIQPVYPVAVDDPARGIRHLRYFTDEWYAVVSHTIREARRLGLQLDFTLGSGWPYGGPFLPPGLSARRVRALSQEVIGPRELAWDVAPALTGEERVAAVVAAPVLAAGELDVSRGRVLAQPAPEVVRGTRRGAWIRFAAPEGRWRVLAVVDSPTGQQVKRPTLGMEGPVLDHHNREALALFLRAAGDRMMDGVRGAGDPPFHSIFCDSLEVYGADWTRHFLDEFKKRRGYDFTPSLPALWHDAGPATAHLRYDYRQTLSELELEYFFAPLVEWAERRGMKARIQAHGAPADVMRAYGMAHIPEGENIFLGDRYQVNLRHRRLASSAAHVYGRPLASSETYTWLRTPLFMTTLEQMKAATDAVLLDGLNHIVNHGYAYSPPEAGQPGWNFYASTEINHTNTWWRHYRHVALYVQRACALLQQGTSVNRVAVYLPLADVFAETGAGTLHVDVETDARLDPALLQGLREGGHDFDLLQDHALSSVARVEGATLRAGTGVYEAVVVPPVRFMPPESAERLAELARAGGRVIFIGQGPEAAPGLQEQAARTARLKRVLEGVLPEGSPGAGKATRVADTAAALSLVRAAVPPAFHIREAGDGGDAASKAARENVGFVQRRSGDATFFFVANVSGLAHDLRVQLDAGHRRPERWDLGTGEVQETLVYEYARQGSRPVTEVELHLEPFESVVVAFGTAADAPILTRTDWPGPLRITRSGRGTEVSGAVGPGGRHAVTLASGKAVRFEPKDVPPAVEINGPWTLALGERPAVPFERLRSWDELPEGKTYSGWATYETEFTMGALPSDVAWVLDLGTVHETAEATLNGVPLGAAWKAPRRLACGDALRAGTNRLKVMVANLWVHHMATRPAPAEWKVLEETVGIRWGRYGEVPPEKMPPAGLLGPVRLLPRKRHTLKIP